MGIPAGKALTLKVGYRGEGMKNKAYALVTLAPPDPPLFKRMRKSSDLPPRDIAVILESLLPRLLADPIVPDPAAFHCRAMPATKDGVLFEAFSPERYPDTREVLFDASGLPTALERPEEYIPERFTWGERKGDLLLTGIEGAFGAATIHCRRVKNRWVPDRLTIVAGERKWAVTLSDIRLR